ncbi:sialate O-acetylesterase [Bifidobacterium miconisargentati]|uniref:sialate O-acetylesterase n=1 Tax=Bifidobacterium miconisargentati TaxID=2834437 RepID=UPI001BDC1EC6|nr:sialate O-acetylesterase [Bifidobacterium miconisargentati]MBW3091132.1 sialate O-acetylesterase [Bifidobacterium miconisargentati]
MTTDVGIEIIHVQKRVKYLLIAVAFLAGCVVAGLAVAFATTPSTQQEVHRNAVPSAQKNDAKLTVTLPNYYSPGMVMQRGKSLAVKGQASVQSSLTVTITDGKRTSSSTIRTAKNGTFTASLKALPAQLDPYTLTIASHGKTLAKVNEVYIGDVFLAAGQSNMEYGLRQYLIDPNIAKDSDGNTVINRADFPQTVSDKNIHFIITDDTVTNDAVSTDLDLPLKDYCADQWLPAVGTDATHMGYLPQLFAERLREQSPKVPIGIIQTAWGGTDIAPHMQGGKIYRHHIQPLENTHVAAVLWYQGEDDAATSDRALAYLYRFTTLIGQYRAAFGEDDLPFLYVQLARYGKQPYTATVRQAQADALRTAANTKNLGMTVAIDTDKGTSAIIHPLGKDIIAARMADQWQAIRKGTTIPMGPIAEQVKTDEDDPGTATVSFSGQTGQGLAAMTPVLSKKATADSYAKPSTASLRGFEAAGADGKFVPATATINADGKTLTITADGIETIRQVRYQWTGSPSQTPFLYNELGLPASPFSLSVDRVLE